MQDRKEEKHRFPGTHVFTFFFARKLILNVVQMQND